MRVEKKLVSPILWLAVFVLAGLSGFSGTQGLRAFGGPSDGAGGDGTIRALAENDDSWELKLDADARLLLRFLDTGQASQLDQLSDRLTISSAGEDQDSLEVGAFVLLNDSGAAPLLAELGVKVSTQIGDIAVCRLPIESLPLVAQQPFVQLVEMSRPVQFYTDVSRPEILADQVHQGLNLPQAYRGRGVVVGVVDTGIDFTHPDFSDTNGTRIAYLLELLANQGEAEYDKNQIDTNPASVTQRDTMGHGTHVAGIAAGGGRGNPIYRGIAPEADIIFVDCTRGGTQPGIDDIAYACQYIFDKAQGMGKPAVINLSLGFIGETSNDALSNQALCGLTGPGKIIVAAAGNLGQEIIHAGGEVSPVTIYGPLLEVKAQASQSWVGIWCKAGTLTQFQVRAYKENAGQMILQGSTPWVQTGQLKRFTLTDAGTNKLGYVQIDALTTGDPRTTDSHAMICIYDSGPGLIEQSHWLLACQSQNAGRVHMWARSTGDAFSPVTHNIVGVTEWPGDANCTVASPAIADKVISVGAYTTKVDWIDAWGNSRSSSEQLGQLASMSSKGPTPEGKCAPDICAPGSEIAAPLSSDFLTWLVLNRIIVQDLYWLDEGTSMSAPHVAGVVALMLEANPTLDPDKVTQILKDTARSDSFTGFNLPDNRFGWGKIDALAAVQAAAASTPPVAQDVPMTGTVDSPTTVMLQAADDGLPIPPGALTYTITSLPAHGQLEDLGGTPIGQAPAALPGFANQVVYRPNTGWSGQDSFTFCADDGGTPPFGGPSNTATVQISIISEITVDYQVSAGVDDVHLMKYSTYQNTNTVEIDIGNYTNGFRFQNIQIPQGAAIKSATLSIRSYWFGLEGEIKGKLQAEAADNPGDFTIPTQRLSLVPLTGASQAWNIGPASWTGDTWYDTPDIASVLQEVIDRPGWTPGNALVVVYTTSSFTQDRRIWAYDGDPTKAAKLTITYQPK